MKHSRKMLALILILVLVLTLCVQGIALAASAPATDNPPIAEDENIPAEPEPAPEYPEEPTDIADSQLPVEDPVPEEESAQQAIGEEMAVQEVPEAKASTTSFEVTGSNKNGLILTYTGTDANVVFPAVYNDQKVYCVSGVKSTSRQYVKTIRLEEGYTYLNNNSFAGCVNLTSITLPSTLKGAGHQIFMNCSSLKEISFPDSFKGIGIQPFRNYTALTKVVIAKNAKISGNSSFFQGCDTSKIWIWGVPGTDAEELAIFCRANFRSTVKFNLSAPKNLTLSTPNGNYTQVKLEFSASKYTHYYEIYRSSKQNNGYKLIKTLSPFYSSQSFFYYIDTNIQMYHTYYYKVRAVSNYSSPVTKSSFTYPRSIQHTLQAPVLRGWGSDSINLGWSQVGGASGYFVYRSNIDSNYQLIATITSGSQTYYSEGINGNVGDDLYFRVVPYCDVDGKRILGPISNFVRCKIINRLAAASATSPIKDSPNSPDVINVSDWVCTAA